MRVAERGERFERDSVLGLGLRGVGQGVVDLYLKSILGQLAQDIRDSEAFQSPHHLIGNRMLISFDGTIRLDTRWSERMSEKDKHEIIAQAGAAAEAFGYA